MEWQNVCVMLPLEKARVFLFLNYVRSIDPEVKCGPLEHKEQGVLSGAEIVPDPISVGVSSYHSGKVQWLLSLNTEGLYCCLQEADCLSS